MRIAVIALCVAVVAVDVSAQTPVPVTAVAPNPPTPMTGKARVGWVVDGSASPRSLLAGTVVAGWSTAIDSPSEWGRGWDGYGKRYMAREADLAVSNTIEAGLGALWDEDPRYFRAEPGPIKARIAHALRGAVLARRHDSDIPAFARYTANVGGVFIGHLWRPASASTPANETLSLAGAVVGRSLANLWEEFWPDVRRRLHH